MSELILGTAQFGAAYGATNTVGRLDDSTVSEIAWAAIDFGIRVFDTSAMYGDAETRIQQLDLPVELITKLILPPSPTFLSQDNLLEVLKRLGREKIEGLLFHSVDDLRDSRLRATWELLSAAREKGQIQKLGASIYSEEDLEVALSVLPEMDLIQIPGNVVDRRLLDHPLLTSFHQAGGTVHVRSAFLQGILLLESQDCPKHLSGILPVLFALNELQQRTGANMLQILLGVLKHHPNVDGVVVGALSKNEILSIVDAWNSTNVTEVILPQVDEVLLDPREWKKMTV